MGQASSSNAASANVRRVKPLAHHVAVFDFKPAAPATPFSVRALPLDRVGEQHRVDPTILYSTPPDQDQTQRNDRGRPHTAESIIRLDLSEADLAERVGYLSRVLGEVVTAAIAGVDDARLVEAWSHGLPIEEEHARRSMRAAYRVAKLLGASLSEPSVQAWFMGMNPHLDDRSPVEVLREDPDQVVQAADDFLTHG